MKKVIVNKWDTILIKWIDAVACTSWRDTESFSNRVCHVNSIGMFVGEDDIYWTICLNHDWVNNNMSEVMSIPKSMINYVEILKRAV